MSPRILPNQGVDGRLDGQREKGVFDEAPPFDLFQGQSVGGWWPEVVAEACLAD
jgi:hypothetical protein